MEIVIMLSYYNQLDITSLLLLLFFIISYDIEIS